MRILAVAPFNLMLLHCRANGACAVPRCAALCRAVLRPVRPTAVQGLKSTRFSGQMATFRTKWVLPPVQRKCCQ